MEVINIAVKFENGSCYGCDDTMKITFNVTASTTGEVPIVCSNTSCVVSKGINHGVVYGDLVAQFSAPCIKIFRHKHCEYVEAKRREAEIIMDGHYISRGETIVPPNTGLNELQYILNIFSAAFGRKLFMQWSAFPCL